MQQVQASQLEGENKFPNCVFIKLHKRLAQPEETNSSPIVVTATRPSPTRPTVLKLTLRFGEHSIEIPGGLVKFGLKRGQLQLKLTNGKIPIETMGLTRPFEVVIETEVQQERGRETEANLAMAAGLKSKDVGKTTNKQKCSTYQVSTQGTEEEPVWVFEAKTQEPILRGQLTEETLGVIQATAEECHIEATFAVNGQNDLCLLNSEGLLRAKNLSRNKTALLTREFLSRYIAPKLHPHLSKLEGTL